MGIHKFKKYISKHLYFPSHFLFIAENCPAESSFSPASMAVVNEIMYVIGGNIYHENDDVEHRPVPVELFDPKKEAWEMLDIKSDGITLRSVCVLDNKVVTTVVSFSCTCCNSF